MPVSRRSLLTGLAAAIASPLAGLDPAYAAALAGTAGLPAPPRLWLRRERTGEEVCAVLRTPAGENHPDLLLLSWLLRDVEDGSAAVWIDPRLFDLLVGVQGAMSAVHGAVVPLIVTSGYRTPRHNAGLEDAAKSSLHLAGRAADVKAAGYGPGAVATAGAFQARGGVGIYPSFCHLDVGRVRAWAREAATKQPEAGTPIEPPRAAP